MGQSQFILWPGKLSTRGLLPLPVSPWGLLPEDVIFWVLREPGSSSLDLNLLAPSVEGERRFEACGSRTRRSPDSHPARRCLFYQMLRNLCTETLSFHRCTRMCPRLLLRPGPGAALGGSWAPHGRRPGWGREAKQTRSRSASPRHVRTQEQASWPQGRYCLRRAGEWEPGPGLRHALISCINCVGARRVGKAAGACSLCAAASAARSSVLLSAPSPVSCHGMGCRSLSSPSILRLQLSVIAPLLLVSSRRPAAESAQGRLGASSWSSKA